MEGEKKYFGMSAPDCMKAMLEAMTGQKVEIIRSHRMERDKDAEVEWEEVYDEEKDQSEKEE